MNKHSPIDMTPEPLGGETAVPAASSSPAATGTVMSILLCISLSHLLNDTIQSLLPAIYPWLRDHFLLTYTQIGLITFAFQMTASLLQPVVGLYADKRPQPFSLAIGMTCSLVGLLFLSAAWSFETLLLAAATVGLGSAIFHPEASRVARMASGGRYGLAQSTFQVGGNVGSALGPLAAAFIVIPGGQHSIAYFSLVALFAIGVLTHVGRWYRNHLAAQIRAGAAKIVAAHTLTSSRVKLSLVILMVLTFSKFLYHACLTSYLTFFLIDKFKVSVQTSQLYLFIFLAAVAAGTFVGGPLGDRFGRKVVIWFSVLGVLPFTLALPYVDQVWTLVLAMAIGFILASAFPTIVVFAQELMPGRVGMVAGIFFGFAFGMGGIGAALLGKLADATSIQFVFKVCSVLPAIGLLTIFLPDLRQMKIGGAKQKTA